MIPQKACVYSLRIKIRRARSDRDKLLIEEAPEGGYTARALGESIFTEADDLPAPREQIRDAVHCHFDEGRAPKIIRLHLVKEEVIAA